MRPARFEQEVRTLETKYAELVWYEYHRDDDDSTYRKSRVEAIRFAYPKEVTDLHSKYSITRNGFNCAMLASSRLLLSLMSHNEQERRGARENFPDFNTHE